MSKYYRPTKEQQRINWNREYSDLCRSLNIKQDDDFWTSATYYRIVAKITPRQAFEKEQAILKAKSEIK